MLTVVVKACNASTWGLMVEGTGVQGWLQLHGKFKAGLGSRGPVSKEMDG